MAFIWWVIIIVAWIFFLTMTMAIARAKGRSPFLWGLLAIFLPLITVILLLIMPPTSRSAAQ